MKLQIRRKMRENHGFVKPRTCDLKELVLLSFIPEVIGKEIEKSKHRAIYPLQRHLHQEGEDS